MRNMTRQLVMLGIAFCLTGGLLAGCGADEGTTSKTESGAQDAADNQDAKEQDAEVEKEEKPEVKAVEHPQFISDGIRGLVLVKDGEEIFNLSKEPADYKMEFDYWEILNPYDEIVTVNTETMYTLFEVLRNIPLTAPVAVPEGTDTGIEQTTTNMVIDFVDTMEVEKAKKTVYADSTATLLIGNEDGEGNRYAAVKGYEGSVYKIPTSTLEAVYALNPFDYILKIPALVNIETVKSVDIRLGKKTYTMEADKETYKIGSKKVEKEEFTTLYQALMNVMLNSEIDSEKEPDGEKEEQLSVVFHRNRKDAPEITLTYYSYDKEFCSVEVNGKERFLVKAEDVKALAEQVKKAF